MKGRKIKEKEGSAIVMYIRSTSDILPKGKDIRNIADITKLCEIALCPIDKGLTARENIVRSKYSL
uniref:Uncharacterized protein n=1 Tax=Candidatus Methanogaster sp. ANME-2c ERB4 TaxID=2759911 RepID=A0A7G9Y0V9_9EURY|nr:hypothetical protein AJMLGAKO_00021 [Methanosarcinales archaeon ANME-2c ERB4]